MMATANENVDCVLFDMDGVLVDAKDWHYDSLNQALSHFGEKITATEHSEKFDGLPTSVKLNMLIDEGRLTADKVSQVKELKQKYTIDMIRTKCQANTEHISLIKKLKSDGFKVGLCSNSRNETILLMMEKAELLNHFDILLSNEHVKKCKPDPEIYIKAMQELNATPERTLIIEDNPYGVQAARGSGANVLVVKDTSDVHIGNIYTELRKLKIN